MTARLFPLNGMTDPQPVRPFDYGFEYDPEMQMHVFWTPSGKRAVVDIQTGVHALAKTSIDTWCRDPKNYNYKIKDDADYVNTD